MTTDNQPAAIPTSRRRLIAVALAGWALATSWGIAQLWAYESTAGGRGQTPAAWPATAGQRDPARYTLVVFVHPHCPCSRATLGELEHVMATAGDALSTRVVFVRPTGVTDDWMKTDLWRTASAIPGAVVRVDPGGTDAKRFGARTSGHALLYDRDGRLVFTGGITASRGHWGDNPGADAIVALATGGASGPTGAGAASTPVFGCPLDGRSECTRAEGAIACPK